eukprot:CAMPEP_0176266512 /NCGR_PEP_ID=MMETSP0121_2-20121125/42685_1 /TAXON_ID=160619 /ORGANISM="Kryptoperidinium foliaceum, Strain CCMP 1326" /LENGTH=62 /DNA_ID=CAMNT_0017606553 /DNA_START=54 /DNA_END=238 /DNA_ORIENTATION=+
MLIWRTALVTAVSPELRFSKVATSAQATCPGSEWLRMAATPASQGCSCSAGTSSHMEMSGAL